jgi:hypothetical protein
MEESESFNWNQSHFILITIHAGLLLTTDLVAKARDLDDRKKALDVSRNPARQFVLRLI